MLIIFLLCLQREQLDDHQLRRVEDPGHSGGLPGQAPADDQGGLPQLVPASGEGGEKALVGSQEAVEEKGDAPLPSMGMASQNEIEAPPLVGAGPLGPVGEQKGEPLPRSLSGPGQLGLPDLRPRRRIVYAGDERGCPRKRTVFPSPSSTVTPLSAMRALMASTLPLQNS